MNIFNIRAKDSFVDVLASIFLKRYEDSPDELAKVLFLLPNRRSCQNLADAFIRIRGMQPTILPRMVPIAESEEDEIFLSGYTNVLKNVKPAVSSLERTLIFTRLIMHKPDFGIADVSLSQAYALARNLSSFIDTVYNEQLDYSRLKDIVPEEYAEHWQQTLKLLRIITEYWPQILQEKGLSDAVYRKWQLLKAEIDHWKSTDSRPKIVIAGNTAAFPVLKELLKTVAGFPDGEIYLYGLDKYLDDGSWDVIDENHPQFELKQLLDYLRIPRNDIKDIGDEEISLREKLVTEIMRPAIASGSWRGLSQDIFPRPSFDNIKMINCDDVRQEAKSIALIMRHTLETPEKTAALVTLDRNLSRRVISELRKWGIIADDSAGQPLSLTPIGTYLRLICEVIIQNTMSSRIALMKHPFTACGFGYSEFNMRVRHIEYALRCEKELDEEQLKFLENFEERLSPLRELWEMPTIGLKDILETHIKTAERLADTNEKSGDKIIWKKDSGRIAAQFFADFANKCDILQNISPNDYLPFLVTIFSEQNVRTRYGMHPRIKILGPIEARLTLYDVVIIGGVNEGTWPKSPQSDMWMSRPMKTKFGMPQAEKNIGVLAADFAHLMNAKEVYITRAQKSDGAPTNKSRWWLRIETVLDAVFAGDREQYAFIYQQPYSFWAKNLERTDNPKPVPPPAPRPKVSLRPRRLSASQVETLMRDPYTIYARHILSLHPLNELDRAKQAYDFGNIIHSMLEEFNNKYNKEYPQSAYDELMNIGLRKFAENNIGEELKTFWLPRLENTIKWIVKRESEYRQSIKEVHNEINGAVEFDGLAGKFIITAKADRIDETIDNGLNIIDYKTGRGRKVKEMISSKAPQLPIEGMIAQQGGFPEIPAKSVKGLQYWEFNDKMNCADEEASTRAVENIKHTLQQLIDAFDNEQRPYLAKPVAGSSSLYSDYDHLSRFLEWSVRDDREDDGESYE